MRVDVEDDADITAVAEKTDLHWVDASLELTRCTHEAFSPMLPDGVVHKAGMYKGQDYDVRKAAMPLTYHLHKDVPDTLAYAIVWAIYEHLDEFHAIHPKHTHWNFNLALKSLEARAEPYHPGVIKYFKENTILSIKVLLFNVTCLENDIN